MAKLKLAESTLDVDGWRSPLTDWAGSKVGNARLQRQTYGRGVYHMEGTGGYMFWQTRKRINITALQRKSGRAWETWMVDDPLHWLAMGERVEQLPSGHILVAGLGLGLMLHHMARRSDLSATVVEIDPDVIELIQPTLPAGPFELQEGDFYEALGSATKPDAILWDLAVGEAASTTNDFLMARALCKARFPDVPLYAFGLRGGVVW